MRSIVAALQNIWEKNWPEMHAAITGGLPQFILALSPRDLELSIPVFVYHIVNAEEFEAALDYLSRNAYVTIDADTLLDHLEERRQAPQQAVVLTIDDGARNLYKVAFPLLQRYGMKAVAFVAPRFHMEDSHDFLHDSKSDLPYPLSWSQIREMHASGIIDFQSHTYEHRYVPRWPKPIDLEGSDFRVVHSLRGPVLTIEEDFRLAKEILEEKLNKNVCHLAFPKFIGTTEALGIGQALGYRAFWWGVLPNRPGNRSGQSPLHIVRLKPEFLWRLPGEGRAPLRNILLKRYEKSTARLWNFIKHQ